MGNCCGGLCCVSAPHKANAFSSSTEDFAYKGFGASYQIASGASKLYTFKIGPTTKVLDADSGVAFIVDKGVLKAADGTTDLGSITTKRYMNGHLCYVFTGAGTDLVLTSADCQQMCHCDVPIYKANCEGVKRITDAKVEDLVAFAIDGPSGTSVTQLQGLDEGTKQAVVAILITRTAIQMNLLSIAMIAGVNLSVLP